MGPCGDPHPRPAPIPDQTAFEKNLASPLCHKIALPSVPLTKRARCEFLPSAPMVSVHSSVKRVPFRERALIPLTVSPSDKYVSTLHSGRNSAPASLAASIKI